jgi:hypothetical protein
MRSPAKWPGDLQDPASAVHPRAAPRRGEVATRAPHPPVETFHVKHRMLSNSWRGNAVEDPQPRNGASPFGVLTRRPRGAEGVGLGRAMHLCRPRSDRHPGSRPQRGTAPFHVKQLPERRRSGRGRHSRGTEPLSPAHPSACGVRSDRCWSPHAKGAGAARRDEGTVSRETRRVRQCWSAPPFHVKQRQPHRRASELLAMSRQPSAPLLRLAVTTFVPVARNRDAVPGAAGSVGPHQRRYPAHFGR